MCIFNILIKSNVIFVVVFKSVFVNCEKDKNVLVLCHIPWVYLWLLNSLHLTVVL